MGISTQRLMILTLALALFMSSISIAYGTANYDVNDYFTESTGEYKEKSQSFFSRFMNTTTDSSTVYSDESYGNIKAGGQSITTIFMNGVGFAQARDGADDIEVLMTNIINYFIRILYLILVVEVFFIFYGKKTD